MKLEYVGPRPIITHHGVNFKDGKADKYVYLVAAIEILKALEHIHDEIKEIAHFEKNLQLSDDSMAKVVVKYHPDLEEVMSKEIDGFITHLDMEIQDVDNNKILAKEEKETFKNNYKIMKEYRVQRAKNKIFYFHAITTITELIKNKKIKKIVTNFDERHWHVLQSLEGELAKGKNSVKSKLDTIFEDILKVELLIEWN